MQSAPVSSLRQTTFKTITLLPLHGAGELVRIRSNSCPVLLGGSLLADVLLGDPWVSHCHCSLDMTDGGVIVHDFGSTNGTWVNGERIEEALLLSGDRLRVGSTEFIIAIRP